MKICFVGLGSIGKRHLQNVHRVLEQKRMEHSIDALRSSSRELPAQIKALLANQYAGETELPADYDIIFITNPTVCHAETIRRLTSKTRYMFIEKPVFAGYHADLDDFGIKDRNKCYVACPMRFSPIIRYLKEHLAAGEVYSVRAISSSYLPDWRSGIDYRDNYSAHKQMGGGVTLDLIHEIDYVTYLFGLPQKVFHVQGKFSGLQIDSDDLSVYTLEYEDKLAEIHLDYFGRETVRRLELYCRDYVIQGDFINNRLCYVTEGQKQEIKLSQEEDYLVEMEYFIGLVEGKNPNINNIDYANRLLQVAKIEKEQENG